MILTNPNTQQTHKVNVFFGSVEGFQSLGHFGGFSHPSEKQRAEMADGKWFHRNLDEKGNTTLSFSFEKMLCYVVDSSG